MFWRYVGLFLLSLQLMACAMSEEMKRIDEMTRVESAKQAAMSNDLTGEQVFYRSCNTCHPGGGKGPIAPGLEDLESHFPDDTALKAFIRKGKGIMPAQTKDVLDEQELSSLVAYLRRLNQQ